jgi:F-box and leucine-rich repeat protein 2/20
VTNTTLTEILGPRCPNLVFLDIRRCSNINGSGLEVFSEQCVVRAGESDTPCPLTVLKVAGMRGISVEVWRKVGQAFPLLEILDCSYCRDLTDECFREFVAWPTPTMDATPRTWSVFSSGIELTSREAGFDPGDPTKHWRRLTSLRHLNVSGCRQITDLACSSLAFTMPKLEILEIAGVRGDLHDDGLIRLFKTTPLIRKVDLEDATEISDAVLDSLIPEPRMASSTAGQQQSKDEQGPQPGEMLDHLTISYAMAITPDAMARIVRGCKKLRVLEADNTRITGSIIRDFVSRRRHREKGLILSESSGSEIVGIDCRAVSEGAVKEMRGSTRPRRGWRGWEARDLGYEDSQSTGTVDVTGAVVGPPIGQDECDERRVVVKSFHSWVTVDNIAEQRAKLKNANGGTKTGNAELPRWLTQWSLGRRTPTHSTQGTPEEREDRGCVVQ